jgi:hypothetical protein
MDKPTKAHLDKEFEARAGRRAAKAAKGLKGHFHFSGVGPEGDPVLKAANESFRNARLRKVN